MPFIEYQYVEQFVGKDDNPWSDIALSFSGVVLGFFLSEVTNFIKSTRKKNRTGKTFVNELEYIKPFIKKQYEENILYLNEVASNNFTNSPNVLIHDNIDFLNNLDKMEVTEYYAKKMGNGAFTKLKITYTGLGLISTESKRFLEYFKQFSSKLETLYDKYRENANSFTRAVSDHILSESAKGELKSQFTNKLIELAKITLFNEQDNTPLDFEHSLHEELTKLITEGKEDPLYDVTRSFNQRGYDIIAEIKIEANSFISKGTKANEGIRRNFQLIYENETL